MLALISPAKKLDFKSDVPVHTYIQCAFLDKTQGLADILKAKSKTEIQNLMHLSDKLGGKRLQPLF